MTRSKNRWLEKNGLRVRGEIRCGHAGCRREIARVWSGRGWLVVDFLRAPMREEIEADRPEWEETLRRFGPSWQGRRAVWPSGGVGGIVGFAPPELPPLVGGGYDKIPRRLMDDNVEIELKCRDHPAFKVTFGQLRQIRRWPHFAL